MSEEGLWNWWEGTDREKKRKMKILVSCTTDKKQMPAMLISLLRNRNST